jgi:hypothetical protein
MTDYYRDRVRHGGIYSNKFVSFWWNNQVRPMQYGNPEKQSRQFGTSHSSNYRLDAKARDLYILRPPGNLAAG